MFPICLLGTQCYQGADTGLASTIQKMGWGLGGWREAVRKYNEKESVKRRPNLTKRIGKPRRNTFALLIKTIFIPKTWS